MHYGFKKEIMTSSLLSHLSRLRLSFMCHRFKTSGDRSGRVPGSSQHLCSRSSVLDPGLPLAARGCHRPSLSGSLRRPRGGR